MWLIVRHAVAELGPQ